MKTSLALFPIVALACSTAVSDSEPAYIRTTEVQWIEATEASPKERLEMDLAEWKTRAAVQTRLLDENRKELRARLFSKPEAVPAMIPEVRAEIQVPPVPTLPSFLEELPATAAGDDGCGPLASAGTSAKACAPRL